MKYLVELVLGVGFLGLAAMVLSFVLRFLLLAWAVQLVGHVAMNVLRFVQHMLHATIYIFGTALLGAFIVGFGLQVGENFTIDGPGKSADPTMPILVAFLAFFVTVAVRGWQWRARRNRPLTAAEINGSAESPELAGYPAGYENVAEAWGQAIGLAPWYRDDLLDASATCAALVAAVEKQGGIPDSAMIETAALIRNHLAEWVQSTKRRLLGAKPSERKAIIEEMVRFLRGFAQRARREMQAASLSTDEDDSVLRAHLAAHLFG